MISSNEGHKGSTPGSLGNPEGCQASARQQVPFLLFCLWALSVLFNVLIILFLWKLQWLAFTKIFFFQCFVSFKSFKKFAFIFMIPCFHPLSYLVIPDSLYLVMESSECVNNNICLLCTSLIWVGLEMIVNVSIQWLFSWAGHIFHSPLLSFCLPFLLLHFLSLPSLSPLFPSLLFQHLLWFLRLLLALRLESFLVLDQIQASSMQSSPLSYLPPRACPFPTSSGTKTGCKEQDCGRGWLLAFVMCILLKWTVFRLVPCLQLFVCSPNLCYWLERMPFHLLIGIKKGVGAR